MNLKTTQGRRLSKTALSLSMYWSNKRNSSTNSSSHRVPGLWSWILGALAAILFVLTVGHYFLDGILLFEWCPALNQWTFKHGTVYRHRSEGWASASIGRYGVIGVPDVAEVHEPKIAIWGDSFVEGFQVNDDNRMPQVVSRLLAAGGYRMMAFGVGRSGRSVADYYFLMHKYEELCPPIAAHFIILGNIDDVFPDQDDAAFSRFVSRPTFRLMERVETPRDLRIKTLLSRAGLNAAWWTGKSLFAEKPLRFVPGPIQDCKNGEPSLRLMDLAFAQKAWSYLLRQLREQTQVPIVFVYCPSTPNISVRRIEYNDSRRETAEAFADECRRQGIGFINMEKVFDDYVKRNRMFPRGFPNSIPGEGHLNNDGHRLVAVAIYNHVRDQVVISDIHSD